MPGLLPQSGLSTFLNVVGLHGEGGGPASYTFYARYKTQPTGRKRRPVRNCNKNTNLGILITLQVIAVQNEPWLNAMIQEYNNEFIKSRGERR